MEQRIKIVDYNHLVHKYTKTPGIPRFYHTIDIAGRKQNVETTIPNYTIKDIHGFARRGIDKLAVCFDSPCPFRKEYFSKDRFGRKADEGYKTGRAGFTGEIYQGMDLTKTILHNAGVSIYQAENCEADDLVYSQVLICKHKYPNMKIDVLTNDADLLPLVDDQVSVFMRSTRNSWAENQELYKKGYIQITPDNYSENIELMSKYKKCAIPYNTILLHKLLRGDDADKIPKQINSVTGKNDYPPKTYNLLVEYLVKDHIQERINSGERPSEAMMSFYDLNTGFLDLGKVFRYGDETQLNAMCEVLARYLEPEDIEHIRFTYGGMNLRFINLYPADNYNPYKLQTEIIKLGVNLPM